VVDGSGNVVTSGGAVVTTNSTIGPVATIQHALTLIASGDTVLVAGATYTAPTGGIQITQSCQIIGESQRTVNVTPFGGVVAANQPVFKLALASTLVNGITLKGMVLKCTAHSNATDRTAGSHGILCNLVPTGTDPEGTCGASGSKLGALIIEDVNVVDMGSDGIKLHGYNTNDHYYVFMTLNRVNCTSNIGHGAWINTVTEPIVSSSFFNNNSACGLKFGGNNVTAPTFTTIGASNAFITTSGFEDNGVQGGTGGSLSGDTYDGAGLYLAGCGPSAVIACDFENFTKAWDTGNPFVPLVGDAISGADVPAGAFVGAVSGVQAHTVQMVDGGGVALPCISLPAGTSTRETITIGGHAYASVHIGQGESVLVFGNYNQHAINVQTSPGCFFAGNSFFNATLYAGTKQFCYYLLDNNTGGDTYVSGDTVSHMVGPNRITNVATGVKLTNNAKDSMILPPQTSGVATPVAFNRNIAHPFSWT
jgi:hypothetical protein